MGFDVYTALKNAEYAEKLGGEVYRKLLPTLKKEGLFGKYIAIHVQTKQWLTAPTEVEVIDLCEKKFGEDALTWVQRIENDEHQQNGRSG
jgi:hypothetical protein